MHLYHITDNQNPLSDVRNGNRDCHYAEHVQLDRYQRGALMDDHYFGQYRHREWDRQLFGIGQYGRRFPNSRFNHCRTDFHLDSSRPPNLYPYHNKIRDRLRNGNEQSHGHHI